MNTYGTYDLKNWFEVTEGESENIPVTDENLIQFMLQRYNYFNTYVKNSQILSYYICFADVENEVVDSGLINLRLGLQQKQIRWRELS